MRRQSASSRKKLLTDAERTERKLKLSKRLKFDPVATFAGDDINTPASVQEKIFGDFLMYKNPRKLLTKVMLSARAAKRIRDVFPGITLRPSLIEVFESCSKDQQDPTSVKRITYDLLKRSRRYAVTRAIVFEHLWPCIMDFVEYDETRIAFATALPQFIPMEKVEDRCTKDGLKTVIGRRLAELLYNEDHFRLLRDAEVNQFLQRASSGKYPSFEFHGKPPRVLAARIAEYKRNMDEIQGSGDLQNREAELISSLKRMTGIPDSDLNRIYHSDRVPLRKLLTGETLMPIEELAAYAILSNAIYHALDTLPDSPTSEVVERYCWPEVKALLIRRVLEGHSPPIGWIDAAREIIAKESFQREVEALVESGEASDFDMFMPLPLIFHPALGFFAGEDFFGYNSWDDDEGLDEHDYYDGYGGEYDPYGDEHEDDFDWGDFGCSCCG